MSDIALVTGGSGYVALEVIRQLLETGDTVRASVRSLRNVGKVTPLLRLKEKHPGKLSLFEANLLYPGAFDEAMQGATVVYHVATSFLLPEKIKDGRKQMLEPALEGTRNVLAAASKAPTVRRVVMTSTVGAMFGDYADALLLPNHTLTEDVFNTSSTLETYPYHYSKVEAEKEAWRIARAQSQWDLVTINPGLILGPSLTTASDSGSLYLIENIMRGLHFYGLPDWAMCTVDIREVGQAHLAAARRPAAHGRYIVAEKEMTTLAEMSQMLRKVHKHPYLLTRRTLPNWQVMLFGPLFGLKRDLIRKHIGIKFKLDNHRSIEELGIVYRPLEETLADHYRNWLARREGRPLEMASHAL